MGKNKSVHPAILLLLSDEMQANIYRERMAGYGYTNVDVFNNGGEALRHLEEKDYSVVITDVELRGEMDGIETGISINKDREIPLIYLSQLLDEKTYMRARETRPWALLSKPVNWIELRMAIDNIFHRYPQTKGIIEGVDFLKGLVESTDDIIALHDPEGRILYYKGPSEQGSSSEDMIGKSPHDLFPTETAEAFIKQIKKVIRSGKPSIVENKMALQGKVYWREDQLSPVKDEYEKIKAVSNISRNITHRKKIEQQLQESEEKFRFLFEKAPLGYQSLASNGSIHYVNDRWCEMLKYSREEVEGKWFGDLLVEDQKEIFAEFKKTGKTTDREFNMIRKDGTIITVTINGKAIYNDSGDFIQIHCILKDITRQKKTEEKLVESEERFRLLFETSGSGIGYYDLEGRIISLNNVAAERMGGKPEDFTGITMSDLLGEQGVIFEERFNLVLKSNQILQFTDQFDFPTGRKWYNSAFSPVVSPEGIIKGVQVVSVDITTQKEAEITLSENRNFLNQVGQMARVGGWEIDLETNKVYWSEVTKQIHEVPEDYQPDFEQAIHFFPGKSGDIIAECVNRAIEEGIPYDVEVEFKTAKGKKLWTRAIGNPIMEGGKCIRLSGTFQDITENKKARIELTNLNEELAKHKLILDQVFENTQDHTYILDRKANFVYASRSGAEANGLNPADMIGKNWRELKISSDFMEDYEKKLKKVFDTGVSHRDSFSFLSNDGYRYYEYIISPLKGIDGSVNYALNITRDITQRQNNENTLRTTTRELAVLNNLNASANEGFDISKIADMLSNDVRETFNIYGSTLYLYDRKNNTLESQNRGLDLDVVKKIEQIIGRKVKKFKIDLEEKGWYYSSLKDKQFRLTNDQETIIQIASGFTRNKALHKFIPAVIEQLKIQSVMIIPLYRGDMPIGLLDVSSLEKIPEEVVESLIRISENIANIIARRLAEDALGEKEIKYRLLYDMAPNGIGTIDLKGKITSINKSFTKITGFSADEIVGKHLKDLPTVPDAKVKEYLKLLAKVLNGNRKKPFEFQWLHKNGDQRWGEAQFSMIRKEGQANEIQLILIDITDRKQAEEAMRKSEEQLRMVIESSPDYLMMLNNEHEIQFINRAEAGLDKNTIIGTPLYTLVDKDDQSRVKRHLDKVIENKEKQVYDTLFRRPDGTEVHYSTIVVPLKIMGKIIGSIANSRDITSTKKQEEILRYRNTFIETILANIPIGVAVNNLSDSRVTYVNSKFEEIYGWPGKDIADIANFFERVYPDPDYRKELVTRIMTDIESGDPERMVWENVKVTGKDGSERIVNAKNIPLFDQDLMISTIQDITDEKLAEDKLKESLNTFKSVLTSNPSGMFVYQFVKPDKLYLLDGNLAAERHTGISVKKWLGKEFNEIWPNAREAGITDNYLNVVKTGETFEAEDIYYKDEYLEGAFRIRAFKIPAERLVVAFENITEIRQAQQDILAERDRANQYLNIAASIIVAIDIKGNIVLLNDGGEQVLDCSREKALGLNWFEHFLPKDDMQEVKKVFDQIMKGNIQSAEYYENAIISKKGRKKVIRWHNSIVRDKSNNIIGTLSSGEDITEHKIAEQALQESEARYKDLVEKSGVAIAVDEEAGNIDYFNRDFARLFGYSVSEMKTKNRNDLLHEDDLKMVDRYHRLRIKGKRVPSRYELRGIKKDGSIFWLEVKTSVLKQDNKFSGTRNYIWDITGRKRSEVAIVESETRFRELFTRMKSGVAIYEFDNELDDFIFKDLNEAGSRITNLKRSEVINRPVTDCFPGIKDMGLWGVLNKVYKAGKPLSLPVSDYKDDRLQLYVENNVYKLPTGEIVAVFDDITDRIFAELQLKRSYEEIKSLTSHIEVVREQERKNISRDLHDDLGQILTAVKMDVSWIRKKLPEENTSMQIRTDSTLNIINQAISSVQAISSELRPPILDNLGLFEALSTFAYEFQNRSGIIVILKFPDKEPALDPDLVISVYRIIQEGLTNTLRHSKASAVNLIIRKKSNNLDIEIQDNGVGISAEKINAPDSFGLMGMKERVLGRKGEFNIFGEREKGTFIQIKLPLS